MVGSTQQRSEVWLGTRVKTSGGLTKAMLVKNKRGKLVSKKKSEQASSQNNLGSWLREKGKKVDKAEMLRKKSAPPPDAPQKPKKAAAKQPPPPPSKKAVKKAAPKPKPAPKAAPKPAPVAQPKKQPKIVRKQAQAAPKRKKVKKKSNISPVTQQPYEKKDPGDFVSPGFVSGGNVSVDNLRRTRLRRGAPKPHVWGPISF